LFHPDRHPQFVGLALDLNRNRHGVLRTSPFNLLAGQPDSGKARGVQQRVTQHVLAGLAHRSVIHDVLKVLALLRTAFGVVHHQARDRQHQADPRLLALVVDENVALERPAAHHVVVAEPRHGPVAIGQYPHVRFGGYHAIPGVAGRDFQTDRWRGSWFSRRDGRGFPNGPTTRLEQEQGCEEQQPG